MKRAILFDLDNTFYPYAPAHAAGLEACIAEGGAWIGQGYMEARKSVGERLKGQAASHSRLLYFHTALEAVNGRSRTADALHLEAVYWEAFFREMLLGLDPAAEPLLTALRQKGMDLGLVTDLTTAVQFKKIMRLSLDEAFDAVVSSEEAGAEKPDPRIIELALEKLGASKEKAVLIGDDAAKDGGAARAAGIAFIQMGVDVKNFGELGARLA